MLTLSALAGLFHPVHCSVVRISSEYISGKLNFDQYPETYPQTALWIFARRME